MKIGIIGLGVVGGANKYGFLKIGHKVYVHDPKLKTNLKNILDTEIAFICVPTPSKKNGSCDTIIVEKCIKDLSMLKYKGVICVRSSTEPGFTEKVIKKFKNKSICFVPEFLRERCARKDFVKEHNLLAVGTASKEVFKIVVKAHKHLPKNTVHMKPTEAEILKYYINVYASLRVTIANIFYELSQKLNCNYETIKKSYIKTGRASPNLYLTVNKYFRGYGGICLPKDTKAIIHLIKKLGLKFDLIKAIEKDNKKYKTTIFKGMRSK